MYLFILLFHIHHIVIIHLFIFSNILAILLLLIQGEIKVIDALPTPLPISPTPTPIYQGRLQGRGWRRATKKEN